MPYRLADLPDDILFLVLANLDAARDLRSLSLTCRTLHHLVSHDGWRIFAKNRFPSLSTAPFSKTGSHAWQQLAESLTWQSRCWDKRSLQFHALLPNLGNRRDGRPQPLSKGQFLSVVDANIDPSTQKELVVWGAGEDIVARYRERQGRGQASKTSWHRLNGEDVGFSVGYDDITAIKIVGHGNGQAILTGRHNGQVSLLSAEPDRFGERIGYLGPAYDPDIDWKLSSEQEAINSMDVLQSGNKRLVAVATKTALKIYGLPEDGPVDSEPVTSYNVKASSSSTRLGSAKWMGDAESIALAVVGGKEPLHLLSLTPSGWVNQAAAKNARLEKEFSVKHDGTVCPNSLEPVYLHSGAKRGTSLLLGAWRDGTIRQVDLDSSKNKRRWLTNNLPQTSGPANPIALRRRLPRQRRPLVQRRGPDDLRHGTLPRRRRRSTHRQDLRLPLAQNLLPHLGHLLLRPRALPPPTPTLPQTSHPPNPRPRSLRPHQR